MIEFIKNLFAPYELLDARPCDLNSFYRILTVKKGSRAFRVRGNGTVWNHLPSMKRCSTGLECVLSNFEDKAEYDGKFNECPSANERKG